MSSEADLLPGHPGQCQETSEFYDPEIAAIAEKVTSDFQARYAAYGASFYLRPLAIRWVEWRRFRRERFVGDGLVFVVQPLPGKDKSYWLWWVEQEADMGLRQRRANETEWTVLYHAEEVERLLRAQADTYLRQFEWSRNHPDAPYHEHDGSA